MQYTGLCSAPQKFRRIWKRSRSRKRNRKRSRRCSRIIEWCSPAKEEVLEAVKQSQLVQWSNKRVLKVRNVVCRTTWPRATSYNMVTNTIVIKVTRTTYLRNLRW